MNSPVRTGTLTEKVLDLYEDKDRSTRLVVDHSAAIYTVERSEDLLVLQKAFKRGTPVAITFDALNGTVLEALAVACGSQQDLSTGGVRVTAHNHAAEHSCAPPRSQRAAAFAGAVP